MSKLRLAFMGTPDFAVHALQALHKAGHEIVAVYCQPPKPAGRGQHTQKCAVQITAEALGLSLHAPKTLRDPDEQKKFAALALDVAVIAAYGLILPLPILTAPKLGCINIHGSLLPRWRGAAPIHRALLAGDSETGITIMQMDTGLDTGPMLLKDHVQITETTTAASLHDELAAMGAQLIVEALAKLGQGQLKSEPQPSNGATYAAKLTREDGQIDWSQSAAFIERQVRALQPWPGCHFKLGSEVIKVLSADLINGQQGVPGSLLDDRFTVACGKSALRLISVQRAGKKPSDGASFLRGLRLPVGSKL